MSSELSQAPITVLEAVNVLLRAVSLKEATTLVNPTVDVGNAISAISKANASIQGEGWFCNTEDFTVSPADDGTVQIPLNWVKVTAQRGTSTYAKLLSNRGGRLYNLKDHTFTFTSAVSLHVVQVLDWEELPNKLRWYILCKAARAFAVGTYPTSQNFRFTEDTELTAKAEAEQEDDDLRDTSLNGTSPHFARFHRGHRR